MLARVLACMENNLKKELIHKINKVITKMLFRRIIGDLIIIIHFDFVYRESKPRNGWRIMPRVICDRQVPARVKAAEREGVHGGSETSNVVRV